MIDSSEGSHSRIWKAGDELDDYSNDYRCMRVRVRMHGCSDCDVSEKKQKRSLNR